MLARAALPALVLLPVSAYAAPTNPTALGHTRCAPFQVVQKYVDGPWLVPTLKAMRTKDEWNLQMTRWLADQAVVGREAPPDIDWNRQSVVVLSLGKQVGNAAVTVNQCTVDGDITVLDLHFDTPTQWDPYGDVAHPAVIVAVDRADLKNLEIRCDTVVEGLPNGQNRRENGARLTGDTAVAPAGESAAAEFPANTTWGRVKGSYR